MIPTSVTTVVLFFLLVAPGLLAEHLGTKLTPRAKQTTSRELGLVVLWSTVYTILGAAAAYLIFNAAGLGWDHLNKAMKDEAYRADHATILIAELVTAVAIAMALVFLVYLVQRNIHQGKRIAQQSGWFSIFSSELPTAEVPPSRPPREGSWRFYQAKWRASFASNRLRFTRWILNDVSPDWARRIRVARRVDKIHKIRDARRAAVLTKVIPVVQITLKSGNSYCGDLRSYDPDLGYTGREIILEKPLFEVTKEGAYRQLDWSWQRMAFASDEIASMAVHYTLKNSQGADRPALQWHAPSSADAEGSPSADTPDPQVLDPQQAGSSGAIPSTD